MAEESAPGDDGRDGRCCLDELVSIMARLLGPDGCPWDRRQDHRSLRPYVVEEAYEVVAAIDSGDPAKLRDELGDLLLQVIFHCALAAREASFTLEDVLKALRAKLIRRHPHIFGEVKAGSPADVLAQWEKIKKEETEAAAASGDHPARPRLEAHLPALMQAQKLLERAARTGRRREITSGPGQTAAGEAAETELGRRLLDLLEVARLRGVDAELALRAACADLSGRLDAPREAETSGELDSP